MFVRVSVGFGPGTMGPSRALPRTVSGVDAQAVGPREVDGQGLVVEGVGAAEDVPANGPRAVGLGDQNFSGDFATRPKWKFQTVEPAGAAEEVPSHASRAGERASYIWDLATSGYR